MGSEITALSHSCHRFSTPYIPKHPSSEYLMLSSFPFFSQFLSPQQPNIKQKFVALLKRFKVTDEVGADPLIFGPFAFLISLYITHPHFCLCSVESAFAKVNIYFSLAFENTEGCVCVCVCVGEMCQNSRDSDGGSNKNNTVD